MKFSEERWVKLYTRDTMGWKRLSWQARCVLLHAFRKVDRIGAIDIDEEGIAGLAVMLDLPEEVVEVGVSGKNGLIDRGAATLCEMAGSPVFLLPNFVEAQSAAASGKARMETTRELARDTIARGLPPKGDARTIARHASDTGDAGLQRVTPGDAGLRNVTRGDETSPMVTPGDEVLRRVTPGDDQIRTDQKRIEENKTQTRAHAHTRGVGFEDHDRNPEPQPSAKTDPPSHDQASSATPVASESSEARKTHPDANPDPSVGTTANGPVEGNRPQATSDRPKGVQRNSWNQFARIWIDAYSGAVSDELGATWGFPDVRSEDDLGRALSVHCVGPNANPDMVEGWVTKHARAFVAWIRDNGERPSVWSSYSPKGFLRWLNEGHHRTIVDPPKAVEAKPEPIHGAPYVPTDEERAAFLASMTAIGKMPDPTNVEPTPVRPAVAHATPESLRDRIVKNFGGLVQRHGREDETVIAFAKAAVQKLTKLGLEIPDDIATCARSTP